MTISIQGSSAALAGLDLLSHSAASPHAARPDADGAQGASAIVDLSGLAAGGFGGPGLGLATSASVADAAVAAGSLVEGLLAQMRQDALGAADPALGGDARAALDAGFQGGLGQIKAAIAAAGVSGVNLVDGSAIGQAPDGLPAFDMSASGALIGLAAGAGLSDPTGAASLADQLGGALDNVGQAIAQIISRGDAIHGDLAGAQGLRGVNPPLDADAARLAALQVQQQLGASLESIGNRAPQAILALFR